ncbi:MAG TPA: dienelactone hydrolase family protein [Pyrinomonadaceae bacterium]
MEAKATAVKMKGLAVLMLFLLLPVTCFASSQPRRETFVSRNKKRSYYLFVPDSLKNSEPAPLIILFHGSGRDGLSVVDKWEEIANKETIILAGLNSSDSSVWSTTKDGPEVVRDLVEHIKSSYPVDQRRMYLFGHSGGAVYAILLSLMQSEYFAAAAVHAGSLREREEFKMLERLRRNIPLAIWVGTQDPFFSVASVRETRDALVKRGSTVEVTVMPGHDHWYYDLAPRINAAAWLFLKKHALTAEPRYEEVVETARSAEAPKVVDDANRTIAEINALKTKVNALVAEVNAREVAAGSKDLLKDRAEINAIAQEEANLLKEAASISRTIADQAAQVKTGKLEKKHRQYFELVAQHSRKYAEMLDVMREQAEALLGNESGEAINAKRAETRKRIEALRQEADELHRQAEKLIH